MPQTLSTISLLLATAALPAWTSPVEYGINFSLASGGPLPTSGSFSYEPSTSTFSSFEVVFAGFTFNFAAFANSYAFVPTPDPCYSGSSTGSQEIFLLLTRCYTNANWMGQIAVQGYAFQFDGAPIVFGLATIGGAPPPYTTAGGGFRPVAIPEPMTFALALFACLVLSRQLVNRFRRERLHACRRSEG